MITSEQLDRLVRVLPVLKQGDPELRREIQQEASFARIPACRVPFCGRKSISWLC
jgi:hypothetical protein